MSVPFEIPDWLIPTDDPPPDTSAVDPHRVEDLVNRFIAGKQDALFTGPDAHYRTTSGDAVRRLPYITNRLTDLKNEQLAGPLPYYPQSSAGLVPENLIQPLTDGDRAALGERLDAHIADAMDGINRHITAQRDVFNRQTIAERQRLIQRAATLEHNNDDKLAGLAEAHASAAQELARMNGEPKAAAMDAARSAIWRTAIDQHLANGNGPQAIDLFDRMKDQLAPGDQRHLEMPIQHAALNRTADQWIDRERPAPGESLLTRLQSDPDLSPIEKAIVRLKLNAHDSVQESDRAATVKGLDDRLDTVAQALTTAPAAYRPGALSTLMKAYEDAGATDSAATLRPVATHEPLLLPFAQLSADRQEAAIDALPEEARAAAEAIQRDQAAAFAKDAFSAGTTLYPDVGAPMPANDVAGRILQARKIAERQGIPVAPFTADEIAGKRHMLTEGTPDQRNVVLAQYTALPNDVKAALGPLLMPPSKEPEVSSGTSSDDSVIAQADSEAAARSDKADGDGQGRGRSVHLDTDFETFKRLLQREREREAAERAAEGPARQGGAPLTEPAPGSPEYQAADAEARWIVAKQERTQRSPGPTDAPRVSDGEQQEREATPVPQGAAQNSAPQTPRQIAAAAPATPAAGGFAGDAASALWTAAKSGFGRLAGTVGAAAGTAAGAIVGAIPMILYPTNTQSETHPIGDGLRVRTAPGQRSASVELRVGEGLLGTSIGEKWETLPVDAGWVIKPGHRPYIAINQQGLDSALQAYGSAMARPRRRRGRGSSGDAPPPVDNPSRHQIGGNEPPEPLEPLDPAPLVAPLIKKSEPTDPGGPKDLPSPTLSDEEREAIIEEAPTIAEHAYEEHVEIRREFPHINSYWDFVRHIQNVMETATEKFRADGRTYYWHGPSKTMVIRDPYEPHGGSAFKTEKSYFDNLKARYARSSR